jgi:hypothetical protein
VLERAFVVVDEEARGQEPFAALLDLFELDCGGDRIRGATIQCSLAVNWRALRT